MDSQKETLGIIYGFASTEGFEMACSSTNVKVGDYVMHHIGKYKGLGRVISISAHSGIKFEDATRYISQTMPIHKSPRISARITLLGVLENEQLVPAPFPPEPGSPVYAPQGNFLKQCLGFSSEEKGAYIGLLEGAKGVRVLLDINTMMKGHVAILAKTGFGKSYTAGVLVEELLKKNIPVVILDPHGEYSSLLRPNIEESETSMMTEFNVRSRSFERVNLYTLTDEPGHIPLRFSKLNLSAEDIADFLNLPSTSVHLSILYKSIRELSMETSVYSIRDIIYYLDGEKNNAKYTLINQLEKLDAMPVFSETENIQASVIVSPGTASVIDLKGAPAMMRNVAITRMLKVLYEARKKEDVPPFFLLAEEAHNFCPQESGSMTGGAMRIIASEGRKFGLGLCIVTQRPAKVDKNVLSQCGTNIILKVTNPNDLKTITASVEGLTTGVQPLIQRLPAGTALVVGSGIRLPVFVRIRPRETQHGGKGVDVL